MATIARVKYDIVSSLPKPQSCTKRDKEIEIGKTLRISAKRIGYIRAFSLIRHGSILCLMLEKGS